MQLQVFLLTGGNGSGCVLQPILGDKKQRIEFDSRDVFFNGGVDIVNETITFKTVHNLDDGQLFIMVQMVILQLVLELRYDLENKISDTLSDGAPYFVRLYQSINS